MPRLDPTNYPAEGLAEAYERLMALVTEHGPDKMGMPFVCALATVKVALLAFAEAQDSAAMRAFERGQEKLHAGDALVQVGAACTAAAMVLNARLLAVQPRTLSVERAGKMTVELSRLGSSMTQAGYRMSEAAERESPVGHA